MLFKAINKVRMHDTDMAGILYFARIFRFAHDALEDFMTSEGLDFDTLFHNNNFVFVIVHCEADYNSPVKVGDRLEVQVGVENIGNSSFTINYTIYKTASLELMGRARTIHVTLQRDSRKKIPIPSHLKAILEKYLQQ